MLGHYWAANEDTRLRAALAQDWLGDLREFTATVVADACREWRRAETKRPTIADIRRLCQELQPPQQPPAPRHDVEAGHRLAATRQQREDAAYAWRQRFAEERGFADFGDVIRYGIVAAWKLPVKSLRPKPAEEIL